MNRALWTLDGATLPGRSGPRLDRVSVVIPSGVCAIAGPSGAGKTSLLNLLVEFERPASGQVVRSIDEPDAAATGYSARRLPVYWCPPDDGLWPHLSVREHLESVAPISDDRAQRIDGLLGAFGLLALAAARPDSLSEGERARVSVARALASGARVLVMDEPLAHVNRSLRRACWCALRETCARQGTSLVFSSHDAETIVREAEHVICLDAGRVVWSGPVAELYARPPSLALAEFLGPVNWFEPDEAAAWLATPMNGPRGVRPEALVVTPTETGPLVVEEAVDIGGLGEVQLRDVAGRRRTFVHAAGRAPWNAACGLCCRSCFRGCWRLVVSGCGGGAAAAHVLPVTGARAWTLPAEGDRLPAPRALTFSPQGELFILDDIGRVIVYGADGKLARQWWMPEYSVGRPEGIIVRKNGQLAIADTHYHRVVFFSQTGELLGMFGEEGEGPGQFIYPCHVTEDPQGNLYVAEYGGNDRVQKFTPDNKFVREFGEAGLGAGQFQRMGGLTWHDGALYVCDIINNRVQVFSDEGERRGDLTLSDGAPVEYPYDLAISTDGRLVIAEHRAGRVTQATLTGDVFGRYGKTGRGAAEFWTPWGVATSPDGRILVADTGNRRIVELTL
ncbi:MAG: ATP-binding cassette domain-containing protein [Planctomycetaceae bacterium]